MKVPEREFYLRVARSLAGCQFVEQELKLYISEAFQLVKKCVADQLAFKMSGEDFGNASLGRLITTFTKLSDNKELVRDLNAFKEDRNFLSHRAIASCTDADGELSIPERTDLNGKLEAIQAEAKRLTAAVNDEANKFRGYLYFDALDG